MQREKLTAILGSLAGIFVVSNCGDESVALPEPESWLSFRQLATTVPLCEAGGTEAQVGVHIDLSLRFGEDSEVTRAELPPDSAELSVVGNSATVFPFPHVFCSRSAADGSACSDPDFAGMGLICIDGACGIEVGLTASGGIESATVTGEQTAVIVLIPALQGTLDGTVCTSDDFSDETRNLQPAHSAEPWFGAEPTTDYCLAVYAPSGAVRFITTSGSNEIEDCFYPAGAIGRFRGPLPSPTGGLLADLLVHGITCDDAPSQVASAVRHTATEFGAGVHSGDRHIIVVVNSHLDTGGYRQCPKHWNSPPLQTSMCTSPSPPLLGTIYRTKGSLRLRAPQML
ncbi:MAG: hypothetical protein ACJAYU_000894 [Bradymonadia bacterium]|jgi:hypothetical protein